MVAAEQSLTILFLVNPGSPFQRMTEMDHQATFSWKMSKFVIPAVILVTRNSLLFAVPATKVLNILIVCVSRWMHYLKETGFAKLVK